MGSLSDRNEFLNEHVTPTTGPKARKDAPGSFQVDLDPNTGEGTASYVFGPDERDTSFDAILRRMLPEVPVEVLEVVGVRAWGDPDRPYKYVATKVRSPRSRDSADAAARVSEAMARRRPRKPRVATGPSSATLWVVPADRQFGKSYERGGGSPETYERCVDSIGQVEDRWRDLRKAGVPLDDLVMADGGDATEGTCGFYPNQSWVIDLNEAEQVEAVASIHDKSIDAWSALPGLTAMEVTAVSSNHDRPRNNGNYVTDASDSRLFSIMRGLARGAAKNDERYGHVKFTLPEDPRVALLERQGIGVAIIHGDQTQKYGGSPPEKVWRWWDGQIAGGQDICLAARAKALVSLHYHHHWTKWQQGRVNIGGPTGDPGSRYLTDERGIWSDPGLLTFVTTEAGVSHIEVLWAQR